jgi:hypothetical protein
MPAAAVLAKVAIPLGIGLVLLAAKRGSSGSKVNPMALAVEALQAASAGELDSAIAMFESSEVDDPTTAGLLKFQQGRMVARGSRGFTDDSVPHFTDDPVLAIDNQEIVPRLIQLEGRVKALKAWAAAYKDIGAKNAANDLLLKVKQLNAIAKKDNKKASGSGKPSSDGSSKKAKQDAKAKAKKNPGKAETPDLSDVVKQVTDALASGSVEVMRKVAADLRAHGFTTQADSLDAAADELEAKQKAEADAKRKSDDKPSPAPTPEPVTHRTVTVTSKLNSESAIAKALTGNANLWRDLVSLNIPKDADGRKRSKVTASDVANGANPNRLGGLNPGLQPGQNLFVPDDWKLKPEDTKPAPKPKSNPRSSGDKSPDKGDGLTNQMITMLVGKHPGEEDQFLVKKWQSANNRVSDGKYGPGDAIAMADTLGIVPPSPLYWPKKNTQKALDQWHQEMSRLAVERPDDAAAYRFADGAGFQPGFESVPLSKKITSRRFGDGLGSL